MGLIIIKEIATKNKALFFHKIIQNKQRATFKIINTGKANDRRLKYGKVSGDTTEFSDVNNNKTIIAR